MTAPLGPMKNEKTQFAPAERSDERIIEEQKKALLEAAYVRILYEAVTDIVLILNQERQIVFFNSNFVEMLGTKKPEELYGLRPGEALDCVHAKECPGGCGTSESCSTCGAVRAILGCQKERRQFTEECRVTVANTGDALDLLVQATPFILQEQQFIIFTVKDISHEKRRRTLEQIFFHDVLNTASYLQLASELLKGGLEATADIRRTLVEGVNELIDGIQSQKILMAAENHELPLKVAEESARSIVEEAAAHYAKYAAAKEVIVRTELPGDDSAIQTDKNILLRVLGNMIKNAIEASRPRATVTIGFASDHKTVTFTVHNATAIPRTVQLQLFQRSFSTKGNGRGLGTYSMKLLSERYLKGEISFRSNEKEGTVFNACYPRTLNRRP